MEHITVPPSTKCTATSCDKLAKLWCAACKDTPTSSGSYDHKTRYCSKECQISHYPTHKRNCKGLRALKLLYRTGDILQEIFYIYREHVFDKHIAKIENKDGKLYIHDKDLGDAVRTIQDEIDRIVPFPHEMCETDEDKKAVLVHLACSDAVAWMHDLVKYMLRDIASEITEFVFHLRNHKREAVGVDILGKEDPSQDHDVWIVTLRQTGARYILDLAGAQYGYYQPVIPYLDFEMFRVQTYVDRSLDGYFGGLKDSYIASVDPSKPDAVMVTHSLNLNASKGLFSAVKKWEDLGGDAVQKMVEFPFAEYEVKKKVLLRFIDRMIDIHIQAMADRIATLRANAA